MTAQLDSERAGLLRDVLERPFDDGARLVFADHCEDGGDTHRAEFVRGGVILNERHQCVTMSHDSRPAGGLHPRDVWPAAWYSRADGLPGGVEYIWHRGFVEEVRLPLAAFTEANARAVFSSHPVTRMVLVDRKPAPPAGLLSHFWFACEGYRPSIEHHLPFGIADLLPGRRELLLLGGFGSGYTWSHDSPESANLALSRACVAWGRGLVKLPPLTWPEEGQP